MKTKNTLFLALISILMLIPVFGVSATSPNDRSEKVRVQQMSEVVEDEEQSIGDYVREKTKNINSENAAKRVQIKAEVTMRVRERLQFMIQNAVKRYERVITQIRNSNLEEDEKEKAIAQIEVQIEKLNLLSEELEEVTDVSQLKAALQKVRTGYKASLGLVRQSIKGVYEDRLTKVVERLEDAHKKLSEQVMTLEENESKEELTLKLDEAQEKINMAKENIEANDLFVAKEYLSEAREILLQILITIKANN